MPRRTIQLADLMILVAATAMGLAWSGPAWGRLVERLREPYRVGWRPIWPEKGWDVAFYGAMGLAAILSAVSLGLIGLRARRPWPSARVRIGSPGMAALGVAGLVMAAGAVLFLIDLAPAGRAVSAYLRPAVQALVIGPTVGATWIALAASGRWTREPDAIGQASRVVGAGWVALAVVFAWLWTQYPDVFGFLARLAI